MAVSPRYHRAIIPPSIRVCAVTTPQDHFTMRRFHLVCATCCATVPPATNMPQTCRRENWYNRVILPWHRATWSAIVPPGRPSCHRSIWYDTVQHNAPQFYRAILVRHWFTLQPFRRLTDTILWYTFVYLSMKTLYFLTISGAISPYSLLL